MWRMGAILNPWARVQLGLPQESAVGGFGAPTRISVHLHKQKSVTSILRRVPGIARRHPKSSREGAQHADAAGATGFKARVVLFCSVSAELMAKHLAHARKGHGCDRVAPRITPELKLVRPTSRALWKQMFLPSRHTIDGHAHSRSQLGPSHLRMKSGSAPSLFCPTLRGPHHT